MRTHSRFRPVAAAVAADFLYRYTAPTQQRLSGKQLCLILAQEEQWAIIYDLLSGSFASAFRDNSAPDSFSLPLSFSIPLSRFSDRIHSSANGVIFPALESGDTHTHTNTHRGPGWTLFHFLTYSAILSLPLSLSFAFAHWYVCLFLRLLIDARRRGMESVI